MAAQPERASVHLSLRISPRVSERLRRASGEMAGETRSAYAVRLLDEGLRMEDHPGIVFRSGPAGRRPGLAAGPDVWEVARILRELPPELDGENRLRETAELMELELSRVRVADRYYRQHRNEVDDFLDRLDEVAQHYQASS